ncbi:MAG: bifunctional diguanylate cyclase/phosphodiesterase [Nitrospirota bacterium]
MNISPHKRRFSLAVKFNALSISLILVTAVGISLFTIRTEMANYYRELLGHGTTIAESTSQNCEYGIYTEDPGALQPALQGLAADADIVYAVVQNAEGRVLASSLFRAGVEVPAKQVAAAAAAGGSSHAEYVSHDGGRYVEVLHPITASSGGIADPLLQKTDGGSPKVIGHLRLGLTQEGLRRKIRGLVVSTAIFTSVIVMFGSLLSIYLSRRITGPVERLKEASRDIAKGDFDKPIEIGTTDEIADLASSFDYMRHSLRTYREQLMHDAVHDGLTGLPNRALFVDRLTHVITTAKRRPGFFYAVLFIDLDGFKLINDSLGHTVGDQLLIEFSKKLQTCTRPGDTVARLGGDEFALLLEDISGEGNALYVASRVKTALLEPFSIGGHEVFVSGSMGIALSSGNYESPEQVLRDADTAMYQSKSHSRSGFTVFEPAMHANALERLLLETDLRRALERREFVTYYQPILSVKSKCIVGYEALCRWHHPERGLIPPASFIPMAEETGLIVAIERIVLREACVQMKKWLDLFRGNHLNFISVNMAHKQILQPDLVDHVAAVLAETGLRPEHLKLEITENVLFENPESATQLLKKLRDLGVQLYIDDFGTGYSSLSYLHRLPINGLKIDRSFVKRIGDVGENNAIIRTIMTLARDMNIDAVAEGVETTNQLAHIESLQCAYWQGFLFSKPVKSEEAQALIAG